MSVSGSPERRALSRFHPTVDGASFTVQLGICTHLFSEEAKHEGGVLRDGDGLVWRSARVLP
jgi:hypothetical protein